MQQSDLKQQSAFAKMEANPFLFVTDHIGRNGPEERVHVNDWSAQVYMKLEHLFDQKKKRI